MPKKPQNSAGDGLEFALTEGLEYNSADGLARSTGRVQPPVHQPGGKREIITDESPKTRPLSPAYKKASRGATQLPVDEQLELVREIIAKFPGDRSALQTLALEFVTPAHGPTESTSHVSARPLKEDPEFIQFVKNNLWGTRQERGIPWRKDVFEFITETYGPNDKTKTDWIGRGMSQLDIKDGGDPGLYMQLARQISQKGRPKSFVLPTHSEASLSAIADPAERAYREIRRGLNRKHAATHRANK
jgi:hypothetical protein